MTRSENLADRITTIEARIAAWKGEARAIAVQAIEALETKYVDPERLVFVEELAGAIYQEIEDLDQLTADLNLSASRKTALSTLEDALRLVLLEITELGTRMYSVRSMGADPRPLMGVSLQKAYEILHQSGLVDGAASEPSTPSTD